MDAFVARLEAAVGKPADQITDEDLTPEVAALALGVQTHEEAERRAAAEQEAMLIAEFRNRLDYNLGRVRRRGKGVGVLHSFPFSSPFCVCDGAGGGPGAAPSLGQAVPTLLLVLAVLRWERQGKEGGKKKGLEQGLACTPPPADRRSTQRGQPPSDQSPQPA